MRAYEATDYTIVKVGMSFLPRMQS